LGPIPIGLGAAADLFCAAKAAEGASPRTLEWYRMILIRAVRRFGEARPVDAVPAAELRAWLLELRASLAPESIAGYVRGLSFARGYLVNGGDVFSLQQILGRATLEMVRRYVSLSEADLVARHRTASPADRLVGARG
jgi:site-specific recombinase XerD